MLDSITSPVHKVVYGSEFDASNAGRASMTTVDNQLPVSGSVSRYRYGYDVLGRRDLRIDDGSAEVRNTYKLSRCPEGESDI